MNSLPRWCRTGLSPSLALLLASLFLLASPLHAQTPAAAASKPASAAAPGSAADPHALRDAYLIGPGDLLAISVWKDEALTRSTVVLPDGKINFPLIGEIAAAGKTVAALQAEIEAAIGRFVPDPVLSVGVQQVNSMLVYVIGKVNRPGQFNLNAHSTVLQALAMAGGLNAFARESQIKILREQDGKTRIFPFRYDEVADGQNLEQNIRLMRGDVIVVP